MSDKENFISVNNLKLYLNGNIAIDNVSHYFNLKNNIGIVGETGSGKSSLLKLIAGLEQTENGQVLYNNERVLGAGEKLIPGHSKIAYLSQHYELQNNYRIEEILSYHNLIEDDAAQKIYQICEIDHLYKRWSDELSGGEKQRVALASLLTKKISLLLLDEPFSNLDVIHKMKLVNLIKNLQDLTAISVITVSHDIQDILSWSDEIVIMQKAKIIQTGTPDYLFHHPMNEYCAGLLGSYQILETSNAVVRKLIGHSNIKGKKVLFRPGYFSATEDQSQGVSGKIIDIDFMGSYSLIKVSLEDILIQFSAGILHNKSIGDEIRLMSNWKNFHFFD